MNYIQSALWTREIWTQKDKQMNEIKVTVFVLDNVKFYKFKAKDIDDFTQALYDEKFWEMVIGI